MWLAPSEKPDIDRTAESDPKPCAIYSGSADDNTPAPPQSASSHGVDIRSITPFRGHWAGTARNIDENQGVSRLLIRSPGHMLVRTHQYEFAAVKLARLRYLHIDN